MNAKLISPIRHSTGANPTARAASGSRQPLAPTGRIRFSRLLVLAAGLAGLAAFAPTHLLAAPSSNAHTRSVGSGQSRIGLAPVTGFAPRRAPTSIVPSRPQRFAGVKEIDALEADRYQS